MVLARLFRGTGLALVLAVLVLGPFWQGLFFWTPLLLALLGLFTGYGLWLVGRRMEGLSLPGWSGWPGIGLLVLLLAYVAQFPWAVFPRGNLDWVLRVAGAYLLYSLIATATGPHLRRLLGWTLGLGAAAVGFVGFLEFTGYFMKDPELARSLSLVNLSSRMFTSLQYPNTAAAYFLAAAFAVLGLALEWTVPAGAAGRRAAGKPWGDGLTRAVGLGLSGALLTFLSLSFFFTISRGAVVVLPFGLLFFFAGLDRGKRWPALLLLGASTVPVLAAMKGVGANSAIHNYVSAFRWLGAATAAGAAGGLLVAGLLRLPRRWLIPLVGVALVAAVTAGVVLRPSGALLPAQAKRLLDINFNTVNVVFRLIYDRDALRLVADRPLGRGGWGWDRSYQQIQEFNYTARETHDHYAQTAVDVGVPGLLALVVALLAALWRAWGHRRENSAGWGLAAGAALVAAHSLIDFNLSYGLIWLLLWALLAAAGPAAAGGAASPAEAPAERPVGAPANRRFWLHLGLALALVAVTAPLAYGSMLADRAGALAEAKRTAEAAAVARQAVRYDPLNPAPLRLIGDLDSLTRAARLDPGNSGPQWDLALKRQLGGDLPGALTAARGALKAQPMVANYWNKVAELTGLLMTDALGDGRKDEALTHARALVDLQAELVRRKSVADPLQHLWPKSPRLAMDPVFRLRYGQALYLTGQPDKAEPELKEAAKTGLLGSEAHVWLYAYYEQKGNKAELAALENKPWIRFRQQNPVYKALKAWP